MTRRRRILLDVQPRVFRDALGEVLDSVGLDEVLVSDTEDADRSPMSYDAVIVTLPASGVDADVVIELDGAVGHVTSRSRTEDVPLRSPQQLLSLLDHVCPASATRISRYEGVHG